MDGLVERLNQTLKWMLCNAAYDHPQAWDLYVDPLLFCYTRDTPTISTNLWMTSLEQSSTNKHPLQIKGGCGVRGPGNPGPGNHRTLAELKVEPQHYCPQAHQIHSLLH